MPCHPNRTPLVIVGATAIAILIGCSSPSEDGMSYRDQRAQLPANESPPASAEGSIPAAGSHDHPSDESLAALLGGPTLDRTSVVVAVLQRNPGIAAARAGWRAALSRYPQVSWDDPMMSYKSFPLSIGAPGVHYGQEIEISQRIPIGGKLELHGEITLAEADAARSDYQAVRLHLAMLASQFYDDYAVAIHTQAILTRHLQLITDLKASAQTHVANGTASIQDPIEAETESAELQQDLITIIADRDVAIEQLNGLLHRLPIDGPLPIPNDTMLAAPGTDSDALQEIAVRERPELTAVGAKARRADSSLALAQRQDRPDVTVSGTYSSLWDQHDYRYGVGVSIALPVHTDRLQGAIEEALAHMDQVRLEREHMERDIRVEVAEAFRRLTAAEATSAIIRDQVLPSLTNRLDAARTAFSVSRETFASLISVSRALRNAEVHYQRSLAEVSRRRAILIHSIGHLPIPAQTGVTP